MFTSLLTCSHQTLNNNNDTIGHSEYGVCSLFIYIIVICPARTPLPILQTNTPREHQRLHMKVSLQFTGSEILDSHLPWCICPKMEQGMGGRETPFSGCQIEYLWVWPPTRKQICISLYCWPLVLYSSPCSKPILNPSQHYKRRFKRILCIKRHVWCRLKKKKTDPCRNDREQRIMDSHNASLDWKLTDS